MIMDIYQSPSVPEPGLSGLQGMGQVIPPVKTETTLKVFYVSAAAVAFSFGVFLIMRTRKQRKVPVNG